MTPVRGHPGGRRALREAVGDAFARPATSGEKNVRYANVAFDIDGTLMESGRAIELGLQDLARDLVGRELTREELDRGIGLAAPDALEAFGLPSGPDAVDGWVSRMMRHFESVYVYDGVPELLGELHARGVSMGAVTAETADEMIRGFGRFGLLPYFGHVVTADDTERRKPDPEPLQRYLEVSGFGPGETLYVGDALGDAMAARASGIDFALASWREDPLDDAPGAVSRCTRPSDVLSLL